LTYFTRILESIEHGDPKADDKPLPLRHQELRKLTTAHKAPISREKAGFGGQNGGTKIVAFLCLRSHKHVVSCPV